MLEHWGKNGPPVYVAAAAYLGLLKTPPKVKKGGPGKTTVASPQGGGDLNDLVKMFQGTGGMIH
jgi:hypothetical protein